MPRCKNCKTIFEQYEFNNKFCKKIDCLYQKWIWIKEEKQVKQQKALERAYKQRVKNNPSVYLKESKQTLQREINTIIRLIDKGAKCIDCNRTHSPPSWDAGHFASVGSNHSLRYNLHNIFKQTRHCNSMSEGNKLEYFRGLIRMYSQDYAFFVESQALKYKLVKISSDDYPILIKRCRKIIKELRKLDLRYTANERILLRDKYQKEIGIYL